MIPEPPTRPSEIRALLLALAAVLLLLAGCLAGITMSVLTWRWLF